MQNFAHFFPDPQIFGKSEEYRMKLQSREKPPERDRTKHAARLLDEYNQVVSTLKDHQSHLSLADGINLEFVFTEKSRPVAGLEGRSQGIYLLNERRVQAKDGSTPLQTVTVHLPAPKGKPNAFFADKIRSYRDEDNDSGNPRHDNLIRSIESIQCPTLSSFWFGDDVDPPDDKTEMWCEIWLIHPNDSKNKKKSIKTKSAKSGKDNARKPSDVESRFQSCCRELEIECCPVPLHFPEQDVFLVRANGIQLQKIVNAGTILSSISPYREPAAFFLNMPSREQTEWIEDLRSRLKVNATPTASVCVLDTGVNNGHPLLAPVIPNEYRLSVNLDDDVADAHNEPHGTGMCGLAAFGDLSEALESPHQVNVDHAVESVKVLFEGKTHPEALYGHVTKRAVSLAESQNLDFNRVFCLAITATGQIDGTPSSWSASIDQLAFGEECDNETESEETNTKSSTYKRLLVVSAGNVRDQQDLKNYPESNVTAAIEDPAQSWNALTVGAFTNKEKIIEPGTQDYTVVAPLGSLSPFSRTSESWTHHWPLKPDIVLEGGNVAKNPQGNVSDYESLAILTTAPDYASRGNHFSPFRGTSPATAQASWMAAKVFTECPQAWPETVRGLLVHSARWTDGMFPSKLLRKKSKLEIQ